MSTSHMDLMGLQCSTHKIPALLDRASDGLSNNAHNPSKVLAVSSLPHLHRPTPNQRPDTPPRPLYPLFQMLLEEASKTKTNLPCSTFCSPSGYGGADLRSGDRFFPPRESKR
ncbi:hypothetical protein VPH35_083958 [Triticum aestivum]